MSDDRVEELLIHWELSRQQGRELAAAQLCRDDPQLEDQVAQRISILQKTSWMLEDPASETFDQTMLDGLSSQPPAVTHPPASDASSAAEFELTVASKSPESSTDGNDKRTTHRSSDPALPTEIPGFRMVAELGRGGFGAVYRCVDEQLNRTVAIKIPLLHGVRTRDEYIREARNAAGLDIAGIVPVYQVGLTPEQVPFVVQKFIEGQSLAAILESGGKLSATQTIQLIVEICRAVGLAHAQSLVHRDLKPANIIIDLEGRPWVTDFGLSVTEDEQVDRRGEVAGTPSYMAPEQLRGRVDWIDGRTDLWAIGIILYECLTGKLPFKARDLAGLCDQILNREPRPICQRAPHLKRDWDAIFQKCCAKSVKERYDSTFDLASALLKLGESLSDSSLQPPNRVLQSLQKMDSESPLNVSARGIAALPQSGPRPTAPSGLRAFGFLASIVVIGGGLLCGAMLWNSGAIFAPRKDGKSAALSEPEKVDAPQSDPSGLANNLHVTADGEGSIGALQAAIDVAEEGQTITLGPGSYRGSLVIRKSIAIRAAQRQDKSTTQIIGLDGAAVTLHQPARLELRDLLLSVELTPGSNANTVDVQGGELLLTNCDIAAETFDCVRLAAGSSLTAEDCSLVSLQHPAIYAKQALKIDVRNCQFGLGKEATDGAPSTLAGLQASQCGGVVSGCTFYGPTATAIEWLEASEPVVISDCQFDSLDRGVAGLGCSALHLVGRLGKSRFSSCGTAIDLQGCGGKVENCEIDGKQTPNSKGFKIVGRSPSGEPLQVELCDLTGLDTGLLASQTAIQAMQVTLRDSSNMGIVLLNNSVLQLDDSQVRNCGNIGLLLESSSAELLRCEFTDHLGVGIVVDGLQGALKATGAMLSRNAVGILLMSGDIQLIGGEILENDTGVLVARKHLLYHSRTSDAPMHVSAERLAIEANKRAIEFWSPGSYRLNACQVRDPEGNRPHLSEGLSESVEGDTTFVQATN